MRICLMRQAEVMRIRTDCSAVLVSCLAILLCYHREDVVSMCMHVCVHMCVCACVCCHQGSIELHTSDPPTLPQVLRSELNYWKVDNPAVFTPDKFPVFIGYGSDDENETHYYGLPIDEYPGLFKVTVTCMHRKLVFPLIRPSVDGLYIFRVWPFQML